MDNKKIGDFISKLRKSRNMTQKDLADQLGVTDKAVSKWERGAGYPDIGMLRPLADILGTTVNELLEGEVSEHTTESDTNDIANALEYADKIITIKSHKVGKISAAILAISLFIAIFTCVLVNVAVDHSLSWSILVIVGCTMGGCLLIPPLLLKKRGFFYSLCLLTILIIPFLGVIQAVTADTAETSGWLWKLGFPISITWLAFIWLMILLYKKAKVNLWFYISTGALLCIPSNIFTNFVIDLFVGTLSSSNSRQISNVSSVIGFISIAGICLVVGLYRRKPSNVV